MKKVCKSVFWLFSLRLKHFTKKLNISILTGAWKVVFSPAASCFKSTVVKAGVLWWCLSLSGSLCFSQAPVMCGCRAATPRLTEDWSIIVRLWKSGSPAWLLPRSQRYVYDFSQHKPPQMAYSRLFSVLL